MKLGPHTLSMPQSSSKRRVHLDNNVLFMSPVAPIKNGFLTGIKLSVLYSKKNRKPHGVETTLDPVIGLELETSFQ